MSSSSSRSAAFTDWAPEYFLPRPASHLSRNCFPNSIRLFAPTTLASGKWIWPIPTSNRGESAVRSAHSRVVSNKPLPVRSPARRDTSSAKAAICEPGFRYPSLLRRSTFFIFSGTNCLAASKTSATGPSARSSIRTEFVITAGSP